ncbi:MAG: hypothetical protein JST59_16575 [Actinobacteria bacterium]|nr:hypothetical protein [Actinomycetota bacterium]
MNFLKKGPDIKLSELKIPDFVYDLYYDLKERHLLPLVVILLVALVAVPIFLENSGHSSDPEPEAVPAPATASSVPGSEQSLVVARTEPGLRELRRRFQHYRALDPFAEKTAAHSTGSETEAEASGGESGESAPTAAEEPPAEEATVVGGTLSEPPPYEVESNPPVEIPSVPAEPAATESNDQGGSTRTRFASNAIDVRIVSVPQPSASNAGTNAKQAQKPKAEVRRDLPELTMLPARATPAVAFMGTTRDGKKALFLVSSDVVSIFGEGTCVIGSQTCQLLALEPGLPETFVYGPQHRTYRIELLKIERTLSAKPRRASLGAPKGNKKGQAQGGEGEGEGTDPTKPAVRGKP